MTTGAPLSATDEDQLWLNAWKHSAERGVMLQDASVEDGPGALSLLRSAECDCLRLVEFHLDLDLCLHSVMDRWTATVTHRPYALDPDFDL